MLGSLFRYAWRIFIRGGGDIDDDLASRMTTIRRRDINREITPLSSGESGWDRGILNRRKASGISTSGVRLLESKGCPSVGCNVETISSPSWSWASFARLGGCEFGRASPSCNEGGERDGPTPAAFGMRSSIPHSDTTYACYLRCEAGTPNRVVTRFACILQRSASTFFSLYSYQEKKASLGNAAIFEIRVKLRPVSPPLVAEGVILLPLTTFVQYLGGKL